MPSLPARGSPGEPAQKLSEIIQEMALRLLKDPEAFPSFPVAQAALMLASAAWNCAVEETEWSGPTPSVELRSNDTGRLIAELVEHKRDRYPNDLRRIVATELSPDGSVRVHWVEQDEAVTPASGSTTGRTRNAGVKTGRPIAEKLIGKMKKKVRGKLIHLEEVKAGRANAEDLQKSVATSEALAGLHPAHATYVYTQNQFSVMSEQLTALGEMARFAKIIAEAGQIHAERTTHEPAYDLVLHVLGAFRRLRRARRGDDRNDRHGRGRGLRHRRQALALDGIDAAVEDEHLRPRGNR